MATFGGLRFQLLGRRRQFVICVGLTCFLCLLFFREHPLTFSSQDGHFYDVPMDYARTSSNAQKLRFFKTVNNLDIFLYSAIANSREPSEGNLNIVISAFDSTDSDSLQCCVQMKGNSIFTTQTSIFFQFYNEPSFVGPYIQSFYRNVLTKAKQYVCVVPELGYEPSHVTLTFSSCPVVHDDYLPIVYPKKVPGGLAICGKAAFGDQLDPNKLMEWFEVQRLLGVDHIQIMDADNPEPVQKVFRYYKDMGLLNPLPYELPGKPYGRGLDLKRFVKDQGDHDKSFPILECTQRLKGYSYVMGIDMDEVLVPVHHHNIKDFANNKFMTNPDAAGFFFYTQFFVYDWGPTNTKSNISILRYLNSTLPRNECKKYIYLTSRVFQARTHTYEPKPGFQRVNMVVKPLLSALMRGHVASISSTPLGSINKYWVDTDEAVLHHYRMCPKNVWPTCYPEKMTDASLMRLQSQLEKRLEIAREATGIRQPTA